MGRDLPIKEDTPGEPDSLCANTTALRELGWFPTINIMDHLMQRLNMYLLAKDFFLLIFLELQGDLLSTNLMVNNNDGMMIGYI